MAKTDNPEFQWPHKPIRSGSEYEVTTLLDRLCLIAWIGLIVFAIWTMTIFLRIWNDGSQVDELRSEVRMLTLDIERLEKRLTQDYLLTADVEKLQKQLKEDQRK